MDLFGFVPGDRGVIFDEGKKPLFLSLLAFLIAFGCTVPTRGWRGRAPGDNSVAQAFSAYAAGAKKSMSSWLTRSASS